jgi:hypothetical protein
MPPTTMSAAQFMPKTEQPADIAAAQRLQALWIERQGQTNQAHWQEIHGVKEAQKIERRDRMQRDELILTMLQNIQTRVDKVFHASRLAVIVGQAAFAIAGLLVAAKAAGIIK